MERAGRNRPAQMRSYPLLFSGPTIYMGQIKSCENRATAFSKKIRNREYHLAFDIKVRKQEENIHVFWPRPGR